MADSYMNQVVARAYRESYQRKSTRTVANAVWSLLIVMYAMFNWVAVRNLNSFSWPDLWKRYGDSPEYWNTVFGHMHLCQGMLLHPVFAFVVASVAAVFLRRDIHWVFVVLGLTTISAIAVWNITHYFAEALGVGV